MNRKEWVENFKLLNGRKPTPEEYSEAMKQGDFHKHVKIRKRFSLSKVIILVAILLSIAAIGIFIYSQNSFEHNFFSRKWLSYSSSDTATSIWSFTGSDKLSVDYVDFTDKKTDYDITFYKSYSDFKDNADIKVSYKDIVKSIKENFSEIEDTDIDEQDFKYMSMSNAEEEDSRDVVFYKLDEQRIIYLEIYNERFSYPKVLSTLADTKLSGNYQVKKSYGLKSSDEENQRRIDNIPVIEFSNDRFITSKITRYLIPYNSILESSHQNLKMKEDIVELLKMRGYNLKDEEKIYIGMYKDLSHSFFFVPVENGKKIFMGYLNDDTDNEENNAMFELEKVQLEE